MERILTLVLLLHFRPVPPPPFLRPLRPYPLVFPVIHRVFGFLHFSVSIFGLSLCLFRWRLSRFHRGSQRFRLLLFLSRFPEAFRPCRAFDPLYQRRWWTAQTLGPWQASPSLRGHRSTMRVL